MISVISHGSKAVPISAEIPAPSWSLRSVSPMGRKGFLALWEGQLKIVLSGFMGTSSVACGATFPSGARLFCVPEFFGLLQRNITVICGAHRSSPQDNPTICYSIPPKQSRDEAVPISAEIPAPSWSLRSVSPMGRKGFLALWEGQLKIVLSGFMGTSSVACGATFPSGARLFCVPEFFGLLQRNITVICGARLSNPQDNPRIHYNTWQV